MNIAPAPVSSTNPASSANIPSDMLIEELLRERRRDRKAGIIKAALFLGAILAYAIGWYVLVGSGINDGPNSPNKPFAAVVRIDGAIGPDGTTSFNKVAPLLRQAFEHPKSVGVILSINSPGGTPVQSALIHDHILELKAKHAKPVVAVGEDIMASGAYFIAVAADQILANRSTVTGSIGVISASFGFSGLLEKLGVERRVTTAGESKSMLDPFKPVSPQEVEKQRELLEGIHGHFKDMVVAGRGDRLKGNVPGLFEGAVWTGEKALEHGLIDGLGSTASAAKDFMKVESTLTVARRKQLTERLLEMVGMELSARMSAESTSVPLAIMP